jgi:hypothetical protein
VNPDPPCEVFDNFMSAYAWCALKRPLRHFLPERLDFTAVIVSATPFLADFLESAARRLLEGTGGGEVESMDSDRVARRVRKHPSLGGLLRDAYHRRCILLFEEEELVPVAVKVAADVYAVIGDQDADTMRAAV